MWKIIPDYSEDYDKLNPIRIPYTYLHGKLEDDAGHDLYGFVDCELPTQKDCKSYIDHTLLENGKYPCVYKDKPCTLYFWHESRHESHGLIVYNDDVKSNEYAEKCLKDLVSHL